MNKQQQLELTKTNDTPTSQTKDKPARAKTEPYKRVVNGFKRLDYQEALKAITEIDDYWNKL